MVIKLQDKIYENIKENNCKTIGKYMKTMGFVDDESEIKCGKPKKNMDFLIILSNLGLIEQNPKMGEIVNEFHDRLFKLGIEIGVIHGKKIIIDAIKKDKIDFEKLMEINPKEYTNYNPEPIFICNIEEGAE